MQLLGVGFCEVRCQESMRFKNSELRSEYATGTGYIVQVAKQILLVPVPWKATESSNYYTRMMS
jgi:hypothetical protein